MLKNINIISFTNQGAEISLKLKKLYNNACLYGKKDDENIKKLDKDIKTFTGEIFYESSVIIFISAIGIAVRSIAPYIISKDQDAAVIVIDDTAKYVIPLLSGHIGRANEYAKEIAEYLHAESVITTSTDRNNKFAVDNFAINNNLHIKDITKIKEISARILKGEKVGFLSDYKVEGSMPKELYADMQTECGIVISKDINKLAFPVTMQLIPKEYVLGIGARKGAEYKNLQDFINMSLEKYNIAPYEIISIVSIDLKKEEKAINQLSKDFNLPFITYGAEVLQNVAGEFSKSDFVKSVIGVDNVCERAVKAYNSNAEIIMEKTSYNGFTLAIGKISWKGKF